jgi:hypothetical protein
MINETFKINYKEAITDYSKRERFINTEIQKHMDLYNSKGFIVLEYTILNKTNAYASVNFKLKRMISG